MQYRIRKGLDTRRRPTAKGDETGRPNDDDHINISLALFLFDVTLYSVLLYRTSTVAVSLFTYRVQKQSATFFRLVLIWTSISRLFTPIFLSVK